jgi:spore coat polysaccharide biosynthesis predicted glycosyltransferase SpsG
MFAICLESSHSKGMGHLFRMLNFAKYLQIKKENFIFLITNNKKTKDILELNELDFEIVDLNNFKDCWELRILDKYKIKYWVNDRLDTEKKHVSNLKNGSYSPKIITFDDLGTGAVLSDINVCGLFFNKENIKGKKILKGVDYLILNNEIDLYKRERNIIERVLVTLGGSDTYGVTIKVLKLLKKYNIKATIHIGPSFNHFIELENELTSDYEVITYVPSFIEEFSKYDLAITGGGVTPFESNASGLPCLIIANEIFEIENGEFLDSLGSSKFLGYHENINKELFKNIFNLNINKMSRNGLFQFNTKAIEKIYKEIIKNV